MVCPTLRSQNTLSDVSEVDLSHSGPPESTVPSLLGKRSRSQSPQIEDVHDLALRAAPLSPDHGSAPGKADSIDAYGASSFGGWGEYMVRKRAKLQNQNAVLQGASPNKPQVFRGTQIYINGLTHPPLQELRKLIVEHGGIFHAYLDRKSMVTHVVAEQLTLSKWKEYANLKVVLPSWILDSVKQKILLPWIDYSLRKGEIQPVDGPTRMMASSSQRSVVSVLWQSTQKGSTERVQDKTPPPPTAVSISSGPLLAEPLNEGGKLSSNDATASSLVKNNPSYAPHSSNLYAARLMQDPKWRLENTSAGGAAFVEGFFRRSRLHYLSTWKSELKILVKNARAEGRLRKQLEIVQDLRDSQGTVVPDLVITEGPHSSVKSKSGPQKRSNNLASRRFIMHCDFDSFFVSASLTKHPELRGRPVVVCHAHGEDHSSVSSVPKAQSTSEVASASYEARAKGVKNGMSLRQAETLCPEVKTLPYEFEKYKDISVKFYNVLLRFADNIEVVSVDEAMIDSTSLVRETERDGSGLEDPVKHVAETIRAEIRKETSCEASIGIGENQLLARIATRAAKPGGSFHLTKEAVIEHLAPLPLSVLPGFGRSTLEKIQAKWGITTCGEAREINDIGVMQRLLGAGTGAKLWDFVRGVDGRELKPDENRRTVSATINYAIRFESLQQVQAFIYALGREVSNRLKADSLLGRSLTLSVMRRAPHAPAESPKFLGHGSCDSFSYGSLIAGPRGAATSDPEVISASAWRLLQAHHSTEVIDLRGMGISVNVDHSETATHKEQSKLSFDHKPRSSRDEPRPSRAHEPEESAELLALEHSAPSIAKPPPPPPPPASAAPETGPVRQQTRSHLYTSANPGTFTLHRQPSASISDADLREIDIDPSVFHSLPSDVQREQLDARLVTMRESYEDVSKQQRSHSRSRSPSRSRSASVAPPNFTCSSEPKVSALGVPALALKRARTIDELQDLITRWVESGVEAGPEAAATESIRDFFLRCMAQQGDAALYKIASVLTWWRSICRARWPVAESGARLHGVDEGVDVGHMWWRSFTIVKAAVDHAVHGRFGGTLSLQ